MFTIFCLSEGVAKSSARAIMAFAVFFACRLYILLALYSTTLRECRHFIAQTSRPAYICYRKSSIASPTLSLVKSRLSLTLDALESCSLGENSRPTSRATAQLSTCLPLPDSELQTAQRAPTWDCVSIISWASSREVARLSGDKVLARFKLRNTVQSCIHRCTGITASDPVERRPLVLPGLDCEGRLARKISYLVTT